MPRTFYDLMMLSPRADRQLITAVYRHLAKRYHPDKDATAAAAARMMELNEAYAVLSDRDQRARYDEVIGVGTTAGRDGSGAGADWTGIDSEPPYGEAGPPPANPAAIGSKLTFGRYRGWTLNQISRYDRDYLEWLSRTTMGRNYSQELADLLRRQG